jgi:hypothetical protein
LTEQKGIALAAEVAEASRALEGDARDRVREAFARSLLPGRLVQLVESADDAGAQHALSMIEALPDACLVAVCVGLAKVTHRERRRAALDLLMVRGLGGVQVVAAAVRETEVPFVLDLVGALARVPSQAVSECKSARDGLIAGISHRNSQVRFESLRHLLARSAAEEGAQHAGIALVDSETAVRRVAQEYLITMAPADAATTLERMVRDPKFGKRELGERRRLLLAYGRTGGTPAVKLLIDVLEKRRKDPDELREAAAEVLAILGATPARAVLERIAGNKKDNEKVRAAAAKAAKTIAAKGVSNLTPARPTPIVPETVPKRPPMQVETPFPATRGRPVAQPVPFQIVGTPTPATAAPDEIPIVVGEEPLWQDEPIRPKAPPPEIAALLQDYLSKTDPGIKPWPTAESPTPPPRDPGQAKLAAVKLVKKKKPDQGDDE